MKTEKCSFCGWRKEDHTSDGRCYHYSDQDTDYFYKDRFFKPSILDLDQEAKDIILEHKLDQAIIIILKGSDLKVFNGDDGVSEEGLLRVRKILRDCLRCVDELYETKYNKDHGNITLD